MLTRFVYGAKSTKYNQELVIFVELYHLPIIRYLIIFRPEVQLSGVSRSKKKQILADTTSVVCLAEIIIHKQSNKAQSKFDL